MSLFSMSSSNDQIVLLSCHSLFFLALDQQEAYSHHEHLRALNFQEDELCRVVDVALALLPGQLS